MSEKISYTVRSYDPYDLWSTKIGVWARERFYKGLLVGRLLCIIIGVVDWLVPELSRRIFRVRKKSYPISSCLLIGAQPDINYPSAIRWFCDCFKIKPSAPSVGLGFCWMSKNGLYDESVSFITHTPYFVEVCLQCYLKTNDVNSYEMFFNSFHFIESLEVMEDGESHLALSYAPVKEERIVVNANAYAAYLYCLHATYGAEDRRAYCQAKAEKIINWILLNQEDDGSWFYYSDDAEGNFIDCFHSCFVLKNLIKVRNIMPSLNDRVFLSIDRGFRFLKENMFDENSMLCKRFVSRDIKDPFKWDIYDQAEYLGLLIDLKLYDEAALFAKHVEAVFRREDDWFSRIDMFGLKWGRNFIRWGIAPFIYQRSRLEQISKDSCVSCVE
ncbi:hypothetical protein [Motiliproteus sp.]|uniref:hypothetical protein n=1 Tax=Motiliproteus sp. TaxID=1898955 RepID=UPI003BAA6A55